MSGRKENASAFFYPKNESLAVLIPRIRHSIDKAAEAVVKYRKNLQKPIKR